MHDRGIGYGPKAETQDQEVISMVKRKRITFKVSVLVNENNEYKMFGSPEYICCPDDIKDCFLSIMLFAIEQYGIGDKKKMTKGAMRIRKRIRDAVKVERIE